MDHLEVVVIGVNRTPPVLIADDQSGEAASQLVTDRIEGDHLAWVSRIGDGEGVAEEPGIGVERLDEQRSSSASRLGRASWSFLRTSGFVTRRARS